MTIAWGRRIGWGILGMGVLAGAAAAGVSGGGAVAVLLLALVALGLFYVAFSTRDEICPNCNQRLIFPNPSSIVFCETCRDYYRCKAGKVVPLESDFYSELKHFQLRLPKTILPKDVRWPMERCCVCGAPATCQLAVIWIEEGWKLNLIRVLGYRYDLPVDAELPGLFKTSSVPHCDNHHGGVEIYNPKGWWNDEPIVRFKSYGYWREFKRLNGIN